MLDSGLIRCAYVSCKTRAMTSEEIATLLERARSNNHRLGLTGILLDSDRFFFQILEGPKETVRSMMSRIAADPRHSDVLTLVVAEPAPDRLFENWTMAHFSLEPSTAPLPQATESTLADFLGDMQKRKRCQSIQMLEDFVESHWTGVSRQDSLSPELREYLVQRG